MNIDITNFIIIFTILSIGIVGNIISMIIFRHKSIQNLSTFRCLYYLSLIDKIILIFSGTNSILSCSFFYEIKFQSNITYKVYEYIYNFLIQLRSLTLVAMILNKTRLIRKEAKENNKLRNFCPRLKITNQSTISNFSASYLKNVMIFICVILGTFNVHYLVFLDKDSLIKTNHNPIKLKYDKNKSMFVLKLIKADMTNLSIESLNLISKKLNSSMANNSEELKNNYEHDYNYVTFLKFWPWLSMVLFTIVPFVINVISIIYIHYKNKNLIKLKRIKINGHLIKVFINQSIIFLITSLPLQSLIIVHRIKYFHDEILKIHMICELFSYVKNSSGIFIYLIFIKKYKCLFVNLFKKKDETNYSEGCNQIELKRFDEKKNYIMPNRPNRIIII
jgi:hypothetical protein